MAKKLKISSDLCELFGIYLGDGCISKSRSQLVIAGDITEEREYYEKYVVPLFNRVLSIPLINKATEVKSYPKVGVCGIYIFNPTLVDEFRNCFDIIPGSKLNTSIPEQVLVNDTLTMKVIKGIFDTDGSIYFEKNYSCKDGKYKVPRIGLSMTSEKLIKQIFLTLIKQGFKPRKIKPRKGKRDKNPLYGLKLYRKEDILRWINEIKFNNPKHLTKIELWKKLGECPPHTQIAQRKSILNKI